MQMSYMRYEEKSKLVCYPHFEGLQDRRLL